MTNKKDLNDKQKKALFHLVNTPTIDQGCKAAGISRQCYYRWMENPAFKTELERMRNELLEESFAQIKFSVKVASQTLLNLCADRSVTPSVRRGAASDILTHYVKWNEMREIGGRLTALEEQLKRIDK